jgi:hypothetical protein
MYFRGAVLALMFYSASSQSATRTPSRIPRPSGYPSQTTICSSRRAIDNASITTPATDAQFVSIGAEMGTIPWGDIHGTMKATAVLIRTPPSPAEGALFGVTRIDVFLFRRPYQQRNHVTELFLSLYSDDGSTIHNPREKVCRCVRRVL